MILITGGTGFLGKELIKRLYPQPIRVLARNEGKLIELKQEYPEIEIYTGDISNMCDVQQACKGVDMVYHLAAFKHVGMAEKFSSECIRTNVQGSFNLLRETMSGSIKKIIGISTDKAAQVNGVYGASKLLMESLFRQYAVLNPDTSFRLVRYGNVLYSTGSVLCKWKKLIQEGKQCVITEPKATRFYWTVEQAIDLIFDCLENAKSVEPYCTEMKGVTVKALFDAMVLKYGNYGHYKVIGLQKGENLHEKILDDGPYSNEVEQYTLEELIKIV